MVEMERGSGACLLVQLPVDTDGEPAGSFLLFTAWQRKHESKWIGADAYQC